MSKKISRDTAWMLALLCAVAGCSRREVLKLHYLEGFVQGTQAIFLPAKLAITPIGGDLAAGTHEVGHVYDSSGKLEQQLLVSDAGAVVHDALMTGLADAGLKPVALDTAINPNDLPPGIDTMLSCDLLGIALQKNFGVQQTIHGQYFTMASRVKLRITLRHRDGSVIYQEEITGAEDEPPKPVGSEVFLPLETDPAESLSVALSRAIGMMLTDPKFRSAFPLRSS